jgi:hypothetical protein
MRLYPFLFAFCLMLAGGLAAPALASDIDIRNPRLVAVEEGGYTLSADFDIDFNPRLEDAATRGVVLYFVMEFELERPRWYWMDEKIVSKKQTWRLAYHALTRQYRLSAGALHQSFSTLEEALQMLSRVYRWQVVDTPLDPGGDYQASLRFFLDISQLPKPFQVAALTHRDWNLDSGWLRWKFTPSAPQSVSPPAALPEAPLAQEMK